MRNKKVGDRVGVAKMMPHSIEAEQSVLGSVLIDEHASVNILGDLKEHDFYVVAHKMIFDSMFSVYQNNMPIDFVTLTDELERKNMLDSVGGIEYITMLTNYVPSASNFEHYVDIVKRNSVLRQLISASNSIAEFVYKNPSKEEALTFAEKSVFDISQTEDKSSLGHIKPPLVEVMEKFAEIQKGGGNVRGVPTGLYGLDKITNGLQKSDLILIAARPGFGKTSLGMNIVTNAAIESNAKVAMFSLEMPKVQLAQRALCSVAYVSMEKALKGDLNEHEWKSLWDANKKLSNASIYIDDSSLNTPVEILSKCRRLKADKGLDLVMIDYLQLMNAGGKQRDNRQQEVSEISRSLKILAKELDVPVIVLSQLSRAVETRSGHKPVLSDLRESGAIEQDADIVMFIHRKDRYEELAQKLEVSGSAINSEIIIAKHRNGPLDDIPVRWVGEYTRFINATGDSNSQSLENMAPPERKQQKNTAKNAPKSNNATEDDGGYNVPLPDVAPEQFEEELPEIAPLEETNLADIF